MTNYDLYILPPDAHELMDESETACRGSYPETDENDAFECEERRECVLCGGVVCLEHDEVADCGDGDAHDACHANGCYNAGCAADRYDDALLDR